MRRNIPFVGLVLSLLLAMPGPAGAQSPGSTVDVEVRKWCVRTDATGTETAGRDAAFAVGDTVKFYVVVDANPRSDPVAGQVEARDVVLTDHLPANLRYVPGSLRPAVYTHHPPTTLGFDPVSGEIRAEWSGSLDFSGVEYSAVIIGPGRTANQAGVTSRSTVDPVPGNDTAVAELVVQYPVHQARVTKSASKAVAKVGDRIDYRVTWENVGPGTAFGVQVVDVIPTEADYIPDSVPSFCSLGGSGKTITCYGGDQPPGSRLEFTYSVKVLQPRADGILRNVLWTSADGLYGQVQDGSAVTRVEVVPPTANLSVTKVADRTEAAVGDTVTYRVTVRNEGPEVAYEVTLSDAPTGATRFVEPSLPAMCSISRVDAADPTSRLAHITCRRGDLAPGTSWVIAYQAEADEAGTMGNIAAVSTTSVDLDPDDDVAASDLVVSETPVDSPACRRCLDRNASACRLACPTRSGAAMTCEQCRQSVRTHECAKRCRTP